MCIILAGMHGVACIELPKLPNDVDEWKIQLALHDITGWMHECKNNAPPLILPWLDDFAGHALGRVHTERITMHNMP